MGLSLNAIGKRLGVSAQSVMRWVRDHARDHCPKPEPTGRAIVVELDEVWHLIPKKASKLWIWEAFERSTGQLIDWQCGDRDRARSNAYWLAWSPGACTCSAPTSGRPTMQPYRPALYRQRPDAGNREQ